MARKHHKPEEIVGKLQQVEVLVGQGKPVVRRQGKPIHRRHQEPSHPA